MRYVFIMLLLTGCATNEVVTKCTPPASFLIPAKPLPSITDSKLTEQEAIELWINDIAEYQKLKADKNALVQWIKDRC